MPEVAPTDSYRTILGIRFFVGSAAEAVTLGQRGGLVVFPSAPVLMTMVEDAQTRDALQASKLALTDSGLMVLVWNKLEQDHVQRVSGLEYLQLLLDTPELKQPGASFWIMPTAAALETNLAWLTANGNPVTRDDCYLAPHYAKGAIEDPELLRVIAERRPRHIFTAIGGGVQERLGHYLQSHGADNPGIYCIGAAIGFLSGTQVHIPMWADHWRIGWFFRCFSAPALFIPRYWKALGVVPLLIKYRGNFPAPG